MRWEPEALEVALVVAGALWSLFALGAWAEGRWAVMAGWGVLAVLAFALGLRRLVF